MASRFAALSTLKIQDDPEAIFQIGWLLCDAGEHEAGLGYLERAVARGYWWRRRWPSGRSSTNCGRSHASAPSWAKRQRAASVPSPRSAKPAAIDWLMRERLE